MALTFEELLKKTVVELRKIAEETEHEAIHGYKTMHKQDLLLALCKALKIEAHEHHEVVGIDKGKIKAQIRALKVKRGAALEAHDHGELKLVRHQMHRLKRKLRKATV